MLMGFVFWLLFQWVVLQGSATEDGAKLAAGVVAVVGTVLTASLTFVGLSLRLAQQERGIQIHIEAETRLQSEAAIQAVALMGDTADGAPVSNVQRAGAIYALANLGQMPLALVLLDQLWGEGKIAPRFGVLIVGDVLEDDDHTLHRRASVMLLGHAETLWTSDGGINWPITADHTGWSSQQNRSTQGRMVGALLTTLISKPVANWGSEALALAVRVLYAMLADPKTDPPVKRSVAAAMKTIMNLDHRVHGIWLRPEGEVTLADIRSLAASELVVTSGQSYRQLDELVKELELHISNVNR